MIDKLKVFILLFHLYESNPFPLMQAKCQGKEHMIESEISILTAIDHPNIIQLEEVFDFPGEKYLVMEYVQVAASQQICPSFVTFDKLRAGTCLTR